MRDDRTGRGIRSGFGRGGGRGSGPGNGHGPGEVPGFGEWAGLYEGIGLNPERIQRGLAALLEQIDRHAATLPRGVRDDADAVLGEIEAGRGRSLAVSGRLGRIEWTAGRDALWAPVGAAAAALAAALGLSSPG